MQQAWSLATGLAKGQPARAQDLGSKPAWTPALQELERMQLPQHLPHLEQTYKMTACCWNKKDRRINCAVCYSGWICCCCCCYRVPKGLQ